MKKLNRLIKASFTKWKESDPHLIGAGLSFYIIFSLGPLLVLIITATNALFGGDVAQHQLIEQIRQSTGSTLANLIQNFMQQASDRPGNNLTLIISFPLLLVGGTLIFFQLSNAINLLWEEEESDNSLLDVVQDYLMSFLMVLVVQALIILLVLKSIFFRTLAFGLPEFIANSHLLMELLNYVTIAIGLIILFGMMYKILPEKHVDWLPALVGAAVTTVLFVVVLYLVGLYVRITDLGSAYGALGSITVLLVWIFYGSQSFLFGAAFTYVYISEDQSD